MRILMPVEHLGSDDGVAVQSHQVARALAKRGHEIDVRYVDEGDLADSYRSFARSVEPALRYRLPWRRPWHGARGFVKSVFSGVRTRPDVIYDNLLWTLPWSWVVSRVARRPIVGHMHGFPPGGPSSDQKLLMRRGDMPFIAVSEFARYQLLEQQVRPDLVQVVHNGIDPDVFTLSNEERHREARCDIGIEENAFVILFLGRIDPHKGLDDLAAAVTLIKRPGAELILVGRPVSDAYLHEVKAALDGVSYRVYPQQVDVVPFLHAADVVCVPSRWKEPFGRVAVEGLLCGVPVISSGKGGLAEIMTGPMAKFVVNTGDSQAFAQSLDDIAEWRIRDPTLGDLCRAHAMANFAESRMIDAIESQLLRVARVKRMR